jgi:hypothetical protein
VWFCTLGVQEEPQSGGLLPQHGDRRTVNAAIPVRPATALPNARGDPEHGKDRVGPTPLETGGAGPQLVQHEYKRIDLRHLQLWALTTRPVSGSMVTHQECAW